MIDFKGKQKADDNAKGKKFLAQAKEDHATLFSSFVATADEYDSVEEYTDALQAGAWTLTEQIAKRSYRNGILRGELRSGGQK